MGKYDGIKNPDFTDEEFEEWERKTELYLLGRKQARANSNGLAPGLFIGYFGCPSCNYRHDMIRPEHGDIEIDCECGRHWTIPLPKYRARVSQ